MATRAGKRYEWKDSTSYSQRDKDRIPKSWSATGEGLSITVTRLHGAPQDEWYMNCYDIRLGTIPLENKELEAAKQEAIHIVQRRLELMLNDVQAFKVCNNQR